MTKAQRLAYMRQKFGEREIARHKATLAITDTDTIEEIPDIVLPITDKELTEEDVQEEIREFDGFGEFQRVETSDIINSDER